MKKLTTFALGLALALGSAALAQDAKKKADPTKPAADTAAVAPAPVVKKKKHKKAHKPAADSATSNAAPTPAPKSSTPKPATK